MHMYSFFSKLLLSGRIKFSEGKIEFLGEPMSLIPMFSLKRMHDDAISRGNEGVMELYLQGWLFGFLFTKRMADVFKLKSFEDKYRLSMDTSALIGFGDYKTLAYNRGNAMWLAYGNPFAKQYYPSKKLIDHYMRGINAGGGTVVQNNMMYCIELECTAKNGKYCKQANLDIAHLRSSDIKKKIIDSQLPDIEFLEKEQLKIMKDCGVDPKKFFRCKKHGTVL